MSPRTCPGPARTGVIHLITKTVTLKTDWIFYSYRASEGMKTVEKTTTVDEVMDALSDGRRRKLLVALLDHGTLEVSPVGSGDAETRTNAVERIATMNHVHLPKLVEYRFIDWDGQSREVERGPKFDEIRPLLELLDDHEDELPLEWP